MVKDTKRVGKIALFDKALVVVLARGALAMCAMWVGNFKIFVRWVKKLKHIRVGNECRVICLSVSFFIPSLIVHFSLSICCDVVFSPLVHNVRRYVLLAPLRGGACFCTRDALQGYDC